MLFWWICGGESVLPVLLLRHLGSSLVMSDYLRPHGLQHGKLPCPSPSPGACSNSCPLSWWCHPTTHPLSSPSPPAPSPSQDQGLFQWASSLIPKMLIFTLAISCLTTSNLPWFIDLTFQVPMQYCSLLSGSFDNNYPSQKLYHIPHKDPTSNKDYGQH